MCRTGGRLGTGHGGSLHPGGESGGFGAGRGSGAARQGRPITFVSGKALAQAVPCSLAGNRGCWLRALSPLRRDGAKPGLSWDTPLKDGPPGEGSDVPVPSSPCPHPARLTADRRHWRRWDGRTGLFPSPRAGHAENISAPAPGVSGPARRPRAPGTAGQTPSGQTPVDTHVAAGCLCW